MKTILLHDDPHLLRQIEGSLICREGLRLVLASDSHGLPDQSRRLRPDLVVLSSQGLQGSISKVLTDLDRLADRPDCLVVVSVQSATDTAALPHLSTTGYEAGIVTQVDRLPERVGQHLGLATRKAPRQTCRMAVRISVGSEVLNGTSRDLSATGLFVSLAPPLPQLDRVALHLKGKRRRKPVHLAGSIVRRVSPRADAFRLSGLAVRFDDSHRLPQKRLEELVSACGSAAAVS